MIKLVGLRTALEWESYYMIKLKSKSFTSGVISGPGDNSVKYGTCTYPNILLLCKLNTKTNNPRLTIPTTAIFKISKLGKMCAKIFQ